MASSGKNPLAIPLKLKDEKLKNFKISWPTTLTIRATLPSMHNFKKLQIHLLSTADQKSWSPAKGSFYLDTEILDVPETYTVPEKSTLLKEANLDYQIKGCVIQDSQYFSIQKKADGWYVVNDENAKKISDRGATQMLKKGHLFFYERKGC
jgi:hypothetical protein